MNRRFSVLFFILLSVLLFAACGNNEKTVIISPSGDVALNTPNENEDVPEIVFGELYDQANGIYGEDYISLYDLCGKDAEISDVVFIDDIPYISYEGKLYTPGLDFLSRAMVENSAPGDIRSYEFWSELYLKRLNYLCPEIPLATSESFAASSEDEFAFSSPEALVESIVFYKGSDELTIVVFNSEFSGLLSRKSFADNMLFRLIAGSSAVEVNKSGVYELNDRLIKSVDKKVYSDGSAVFTVNIKKGVHFSNGREITARDFLVMPLACGKTEFNLSSSEKDYSYICGYVDYYYGRSGTPCSGLRLLDDYSFSVSVSAEYLPSYYELSFLDWSPVDSSAVAGLIKDDGEGAYILPNPTTGGGNALTCGYTGPYYPEKMSQDYLRTELILNRNSYFSGENIPSVIKVIFRNTSYSEAYNTSEYSKAIVLNMSMEDSKAYSEQFPGHKLFSVQRNGYSRLFFRNDAGSLSFEGVRRAFALCFDCDYYDSLLNGMMPVPDGGIYYGIANTPSENIFVTDYSLEKAIKELEEAGFVYGKDGKAYTDGVRYKKILKKNCSDMVLSFSSLDGEVKPYTIDSYVYIPLVVNIIASDSPVLNAFAEYMGEERYFPEAGFYISLKKASLETVMNEYYMKERRNPLYNAFIGGVDRNGSKADFSGEHTVDPSLYEKNQYFFLCDNADKVKLK